MNQSLLYKCIYQLLMQPEIFSPSPPSSSYGNYASSIVHLDLLRAEAGCKSGYYGGGGGGELTALGRRQYYDVNRVVRSEM